MNKTISIRELAAIKRIAQNSNANVVKKNKLEAKIAELTSEYNNLVEAIEADEAGIVKRFGHTSEELVEKVIITTDKTDKDGNPVKVTKYLPRESAVKFNEEKKYYEVILDEKNDILDENNEVVGTWTDDNAMPMPEMGNDFDADAEKIALEEYNNKISNAD